jgi:enamine deaminase RidA (YjgF/YER057c/UK114 family)
MAIKRHNQNKILARIVEYKDLVFICGMTADNKGGDIKAQTKRVTELLDQHLAAAGTNKSKMLSATVYITEMSAKPAMNEIWTAWCDPENMPARTCVEAGLDGGALVEITVTAAK